VSKHSFDGNFLKFARGFKKKIPKKPPKFLISNKKFQNTPLIYTMSLAPIFP